MAGDGVQHQGRVTHRAGHGADGVQAPAQWVYAMPADAAEGRLQADDAAKARRYADRAAGVAPQCAHDLTGSHRRSRPAAGAAGNAVEVPRVVRRTVVRILAGGAECELVHLELAMRMAPARLERSVTAAS